MTAYEFDGSLTGTGGGDPYGPTEIVRKRDLYFQHWTAFHVENRDLVYRNFLTNETISIKFRIGVRT
jgi:hypothetical protein